MSRPKFCASCGTPFGGTVIQAKKPAIVKPAKVVYDDEDEDDAMDVPEVENIFANNFMPQRQVLTIGDMRDGAMPSAAGSIGATSLTECRRLEREVKPGKRKPIEVS